MREQKKPGLIVRILQRLLTGVLAFVMTVGLFLVLPVIQAIAKPPEADLIVASTDVTTLPPPPPSEPEPEPEPEPEEEPPPPELMEEPPMIDLAQLELALNPGLGDGWMSGDFSLKLNTLAQAGGQTEELFSAEDLDQEPRAIYQASPSMNASLRKKAPATVWVVFVVDERGRVQKPKVQKSTDASFENAAIAAVKKWKFEPGRRKGKPVPSRMRVPVTFPKSE